MVLCSGCRRTLDNKSPYYELIHALVEGEQHFACPDCFGKLHASRGCSPHFDCPDPECKQHVVGHCCWSKQITTTRSGQVESKVVHRQLPVFIKKPSYGRDPSRYYDQKEDSWCKNNWLLLERQQLTITVPHKRRCDQYGAVTRAKLIAGFTRLLSVVRTCSPRCSVGAYLVTTISTFYFTLKKLILSNTP